MIRLVIYSEANKLKRKSMTMLSSMMDQNICRIEPRLAGLTEMHLEAAYIEAAKQNISLRKALLKRKPSQNFFKKVL
jgi:hypothetical protein